MKNLLLQNLPPFNNDSILIEPNQDVHDIMGEVVEAHKVFAADYDTIARYFVGDDTETLCRKLFDFCKENIRYDIEPDSSQTTKSPAAILAMGYGDCKHYAGFIAGVLSAVERLTGKKINWRYCFASYNLFETEPGHVFVIVKDRGTEYWVDPVLSRFDSRDPSPTYTTDKKVNSMALMRMSGVGSVDDLIPEITVYPDMYPMDAEDSKLSPDIIAAIELLLYYNLINVAGEFDDDLFFNYSSTLPADVYSSLVAARGLLQHSAQVGGLFDTIFRGVKKVSLAVPRGAYLSVVALNVFGTATKLAQATKTEAGANKVRDVWYKLGGDWAKLRDAIGNGSKRNRILGINVIGAAVAVPAWVATAGAIIAALTPVINGILKGMKDEGSLDGGFDMALFNDQTGTGGQALPDGSGGSSFSTFIQKNGLLLLAAGGAALYFFTRKKRR